MVCHIDRKQLLSCSIKGIIIHVKSNKPRIETGRDKDLPWARVSPFVTLLSEWEEAFQFECFLNTITSDYSQAESQRAKHLILDTLMLF